MARSALPSAAMIGAGALGSALAGILDRRLYRIRAVVTKHRHGPARLHGAKRHLPEGHSPDMIPPDVRVVIISVPDDRIPAIVARLASEKHIEWRKAIVLHTSGALSSGVLDELRKLGAKCGSLHPLQSFPRSLPLGKRKELLRNIYWAVEGDARAIREMKRITGFLQGKTMAVKAEEKALYHAACVCVSNYVVTLISLAEEIANASGIGKKEFRSAAAPLINRSVRNALEHSPAEALTGPIERGDENTVRKHLAALRRLTPQLVEAYTALGSETIGLALKNQSINKETAANLYRLFYTP